MSETAAMRQESTVDWEKVHRCAVGGSMPWDYPRLDPDISWAMNLLDVRVPAFLDLGTSNGTQAIELARHGLDVTGTDISPTAIADANRRAQAAGVRCRFLVDDVLDTRINRQFDFVMDRGCLHTLPVDRRPDYMTAVAKLTRLRGHLLLKCVSDANPSSGPLPHRFSPLDVQQLFHNSPFSLCEIRNAIFQSNMEPQPQALFCILRRN